MVLSCLLNQSLLGRFALDLGFYALIYFSLGATWRRLYDEGFRANMNLLLPLAIMLFIFFSKPFSRQGAAMNWPTRRFVPLPAEIIMVFSPIVIIFFILKNLEPIQPLGKIPGMIGRHTFSILAYHFLIFKIISIVLFKYGVVVHTVVKGDVPIGLSGNLWILYSGLSVLICLLISKVASRCLPINYLVNGSFETKMNNTDRQSLSSEKIALICLLILSFASVSWALDHRNWFVFDDFTNIKAAEAVD